MNVTASVFRLAIVSAALSLLPAPAPVIAADTPNDSAQTAVPRSVLLQFLAEPSTFTLIDARSSEEFAANPISGAINIPHDAPGDQSASLPADTDAPIVVYCKTGKRAGLLRQKLAGRGYTNVSVLKPEQIFWFDDMAVFNCGVPAGQEPAADFTSMLHQGTTEETK